MDHLLPTRSVEPDDEEKTMACLMGLLSQLAAKPEVMRVAALHKASLHNAVASAIAQIATTTETPLQDAGLDGTGEVIRVLTVFRRSYVLWIRTVRRETPWAFSSFKRTSIFITACRACE